MRFPILRCEHVQIQNYVENFHELLTLRLQRFSNYHWKCNRFMGRYIPIHVYTRVRANCHKQIDTNFGISNCSHNILSSVIPEQIDFVHPEAFADHRIAIFQTEHSIFVPEVQHCHSIVSGRYIHPKYHCLCDLMQSIQFSKRDCNGSKVYHSLPSHRSGVLHYSA